MFFTPELLTRRDSGFGLLWLAATLGAKSSFKKLPKRSVVAADIAQLCNLIADPPEPLALRLSSNLMIGAVRVYKVKQEIFLADVTTCFTALKKAVEAIRMSTAADLQMVQSSVRPDAVSFRVDPNAAFALEFEHLFPEWDKDYAGENSAETDDEFDPTIKRKKQKKGKETASQMGTGRGNLHTLNENYDHLLSQSFDVSFHDSGLGVVGASSSQAGFGFEDDFLGGLDEGNDIGDELARELGADWGVLPAHRAPGIGKGADHFDIDMMNHVSVSELPENPLAIVANGDNDPFMTGVDIASLAASVPGRRADATSPGASIVHTEVRAANEPPNSTQCGDEDVEMIEKEGRKLKRVRLLLDNRTELTNEELQKARTLYIEEQAQIRREMDEKRAEKDGEVLLNEMIIGIPRGLHTSVLVDFWLENFRLQVEARSGQLILDAEGQPPRKRRRLGPDEDAKSWVGGAALGDIDSPFQQGVGHGDVANFGLQDGHRGDMDFRLRSSEEPGQARRLSQPPSVPGSHLDLHGRLAEGPASQRSAVFPWDNAGGVSSSAAGAPFEITGSDRFSISIARGQRRSSRGSESRRESPTYPVPGSPAGLNFGDPQTDGDVFEFNVGEVHSRVVESQQSDINLMALERHSLDFLEYCKMQSNAFPSQSGSVGFDDIVPNASSTPHVAAAAFYHCLVLATKDLLRLDQTESFAPIRITVK